MATVIESLIVELGLDPKKFSQGQREAVDAYKKTQQQAVDSSKAIEKAADKVSDSLQSVARSALGMFAAFAGFRGLKDFIGDLVTADANLGRFSANLSAAPQTVSAWEQAAVRFGGSTQGVAATFERLGKMLYDLRYNAKNLPDAFGQLAKAASQSIDFQSGNPVKTLTDILTALQKVHDSRQAGGPIRAHFLAQELGIDPGLEQLAYEKGSGITAYVAEIAKSNTPTAEAIENAKKLQENYEALRQSVSNLLDNGFRQLAPILTDIVKDMNAWMTANKDWINTQIVENVNDFKQALPEIRDDLKLIADHFDEIKIAAGAVIALWAGDKFLKAAANMRILMGGGGAAVASRGASGGWGALGVLGAAAGGIWSLFDPGEGLKNAPRSKWGVDDVIRWMLGTDGSKTSGDASGHADALQNNSGGLGNGRDAALDTFLNGDTKVDGRPVSKSNPLPVTLSGQGSGGGGSWWDSLTSWFTGNNKAPPGPLSNSPRSSALDVDDSGIPNGTPSNKVMGSAKRIMDRLITKHGWTPAAAAISAGQAWAESGFRPGEKGDPQVPGGSWGMFQWNRSRLARLKQWAKQQGRDWKDFDTQIDFHAMEAEEMIPNWKSQKNLSNADAIGKRYEGYRGPIQKKRSAMAAKFLGEYRTPSESRLWRGSGNSGIGGTVTDSLMGAALSSRLNTVANNNVSTTNSSTASVNIGSVNVHTQATDSKGIAGSIGNDLKTTIQTQAVNTGPN